MTANPSPEPVTLKGLIVPAGWDEHGNVTAVALSTYDEEEYLIEDAAEGELLFLARERVELTGLVGTRGGIKTIQVTAFSRKGPMG